MKAKEYYQKYFGHFDMTKIAAQEFWDVMNPCMTEFVKEQGEAVKSVQSQASKISKFREFEKRWVSLSELIEKSLQNNANFFKTPEERTTLPLELKTLMRNFIMSNAPLLAHALGY